VSPTLEREKDNHIHQSDGGPSSYLEADNWNWSDYRTCPPTKKFLRNNRGKVPFSLVLLHLWQRPGLTPLNPKASPLISQGKKDHPQQAKRAIVANWTEGISGSATIA